MEKIETIDYEDEMGQDYIDYSMSVIMSRALPDVRDGLKPVHRRILYAMYEDNLVPQNSYRKSATTVGNVLGRYHPHGDSSVYEALVRLSQDFLLNAPLVDGNGNFGSVDGDGAAAYRYTEARLQKVSLLMLEDINKNTVDFRENFDGNRKEPTVLPARFPQLLVNGVSGIAVGMMTNIPPHNPSEVLQAIQMYLKNPDISNDKLLSVMHGPDFPTGGIIINKDELSDIYRTGAGKIKIRAKIEQEKGDNGRTNLVVTEIPYTWSGCKNSNIEKIISMMSDGKLNELYDLRDESNMDGIRIVLEVKKGVDVQNFINKLYAKTSLEDTMPVSFLAIVDGKPRELSLYGIIENYIKFQKEINLRKYTFLLEKEKHNFEILDGLKQSCDILDLILEVIRGSEDVSAARNCLCTGNIDRVILKTKKSMADAKKLHFTEVQANAILSMQLQKLIRLEIRQLEESIEKAKENLKIYEDILNNEESLVNVISKSLSEMRSQFKQKRKTAIRQMGDAIYVEETTAENIVFMIDKFGYTKAIDTASFKRLSAESIDEYVSVIPSKSTDKLCAFTKTGQIFQVKAEMIPRGKNKDKGVLYSILSKSEDFPEVLFYVSWEHLSDKTLFITTENGNVKKMPATELETNRTSIPFIKMDADDSVVSVNLFEQAVMPEYILITTQNNEVLKFKTSEIPDAKRNGTGVKGIDFTDENRVIGVAFADNNDSEITVFGKTQKAGSVKAKKRGSKGTKVQ